MINRWRKMMVGTGKGRAGLGGLQKQALATVANVGAGEDDLQTVTLEANSLYKNGQTIRITCFGKCAANGNNKTVKLYFGGTQILTTGAVAANDKGWMVRAIVYRTAVAVQIAYAWGTFNDTEIAVTKTALTKNEATDLVIKCTGEATADNDISQDLLIVEALAV